MVDVQIINEGKTTAKDVSIMATMQWEKKGDNYVPNSGNWRPILLAWFLPKNDDFDGKIIPKRPYIFTIGGFSYEKPSYFLWSYVYINTGQPDYLTQGDYCIEIKVFSDNVKLMTKYLYFGFKEFSSATNLNELISKIIYMKLSDQHPKRMSKSDFMKLVRQFQ